MDISSEAIQRHSAADSNFASVAVKAICDDGAGAVFRYDIEDLILPH